MTKQELLTMEATVKTAMESPTRNGVESAPEPAMESSTEDGEVMKAAVKEGPAKAKASTDHDRRTPIRIVRIGIIVIGIGR